MRSISRLTSGFARATIGEALHEPIDDPAFPGLMVRTGMPYVVEGPDIGRVLLDESERTVLVGETPGTLHPPKGWGRRAADNVSVVVGGREVKLAHRRRRAARLLLDGTPVANLKASQRARDHRPYDRQHYTVEWEPGVHPRVVGVGHALATRYGVGAPGAGRRLLRSLTGFLSIP
ncbi:hypothetical protein [Paraconexibacter sp. AEG42_29]